MFLLSAGADIEAMSAMNPLEAEAFSRLGHETFAALEELADQALREHDEAETAELGLDEL